MSKSHVGEQATLDFLLTAKDVATLVNGGVRPTAWFVALFSDDPGDDGSGTEINGVDTEYLRKPVFFSVSTLEGTPLHYQATNSGTLADGDGNPVLFPPAATGAVYTVTHFAITDSVTIGGGNILYSGALCVPKDVTETVQVRFDAGDIIITED